MDYITELYLMIENTPFLQLRKVKKLQPIVDRARQMQLTLFEGKEVIEAIEGVEACIEFAHWLLSKQKLDKFDRIMQTVGKAIVLINSEDTGSSDLKYKYGLLKILRESPTDKMKLIGLQGLLVKSQGSVNCELITCILFMLVGILHYIVDRKINYHNSKAAMSFLLKRLNMILKPPANIEELDLIFILKKLNLEYEN